MRGRKRLAITVAIAYLGAVAVNRSLVVVTGASMEPTLRRGDRLLTVPAPTGWLRTGQIVVLRDPNDPGHLVVKRIVDLADGTAELRGDAPHRSTDSRSWGRVPLRDIRRLALRRWPDLRTPLGRDHAGRRATTSSSGSSSPTSPPARRP